MKAPSRSLLCEWVRYSWESIPSEMVKGSFLSCAITTSTDGSQDEEIHCFKPGQPCQEGRGVLQEATQRISVQESENIDDPFASDADDEEDGTNEAHIEEDDDDGGIESESETESDDSNE